MAEHPASPYSYDQWDEDLVDLSFQSVPDLHHLLTDRGSHLDYQLYSQAAILHNMLRKELNSVTVKPPESSTFSADYSSNSDPSLSDEPISSDNSSTSTVSKDPSGLLLGSTNTFSSFASDENAPGYWNILTDEKFHVYSIFCILLILIFIFFIILFLIIFGCKNSFRKRSKDPNLPLHSSYIKASISLEDNYINISNCPPACPPSFPPPIPCPPYSSPSSFSTFHPPGEERTSPEGSSSGDADQGRGESDQQEGESDKRGEITKESLYAKINYQSKHHARICGKRSESNQEVSLSSQSAHSSSISECLI